MKTIDLPRNTLRIFLRWSSFRSASFRARGSKLWRRLEALDTPVIESRPGPKGPNFSIIVREIDSSLSFSSFDEDDEPLSEEDNSMRSAYWSSKGSRMAASSIARALSSHAVLSLNWLFHTNQKWLRKQLLLVELGEH